MMSESGCKIAKFAYYDARHKVAGYFANLKFAEVETRKKYELPFLPCIDTRQHANTETKRHGSKQGKRTGQDRKVRSQIQFLPQF